MESLIEAKDAREACATFAIIQSKTVTKSAKNIIRKMSKVRVLEERLRPGEGC